ncbi:hypothetical protein LEQ06_17940 [Paraclostridium sp. AKS46]|uniref:hypothetical protein n=1 Tax=Paraclostridium bifermentans TaxID=1490 RepID=UPI0018FEC046|nr:hypothetical protein [Paraclostridium bifermentans]MCU9809862.1 hypothetical protein [Paraclostridium sp. AKS46]
MPKEVIIVKMVVGIFLILYGLIVSAIEQYKGVPLFFNSKDQLNGVINGFICIIVGVVVWAHNIQHGLIIGFIALSIWAIEKFVISKMLKSKNERLSNL